MYVISRSVAIFICLNFAHDVNICDVHKPNVGVFVVYIRTKRKEALWQSVEQVLSKHSSKQILTSLCINAQDSVLRLRSKTTQIAIHQDIDMLKYVNADAIAIEVTTFFSVLLKPILRLHAPNNDVMYS